MKSIGEVIKEERIRKKYSRVSLEKITKIKKEFIEAVEKENWETLPEYPVVAGFVKNVARALKLNEGRVLALLRRDYPPKTLRINPKPDVSEKFSWSPKTTFFVGVVAVSLIILGYLAFQYFSFISPPPLLVEVPIEGQVVEGPNLTVSGKTDADASITVNNQPVLVDEKGMFSTQVEVFEGTQEIVVVAKSRSGKEMVIIRKIKPDLESE